MHCTAIFEVIAVDGCDNHMPEAELGNGQRHLARLLGIERIGPAGRHIAEGAAPRADAAHDHHGSMTLGPAFAAVRTSCLVADGGQTLGTQDVACLAIGGPLSTGHPYPAGFAQYL